MKKFLHSRKGASKGAALIIVLGLVVLATALGLAYLTRTTTDRQLAQSSYQDTSADLLARSALDITVSDLKQEIANNPTVTAANIQPQRYGDTVSIPNLIRRSLSGDPTGRTSSVSSGAASANGRIITLARWNSHYLIPPASTFTAPDWVLLTAQGPNPAPPPNAVIGRYAFAVYDEGGLIDVNLGGVPTYASLSLPSLPTRPGRRLPAKYPSEESEIMLAAFTPNDSCQKPDFTPDHINVTLPTGAPCSLLFNTNHNPDSFSSTTLPRGLSMNTTNGNITGIPTDPGSRDITLTATNECGNGTAILHLTINGFASPQTTPWPVNLARKGTFAFADLTTLPSTPALRTDQVNQLMGWRNYATTQQPTSASFGNPWFPPGPPDDPTKDLYARYFLGAVPPFRAPFTGVSAVSWGTQPRTDQAMMTRQELIRLQRTIGFSQSLLQYLGTFSRDHNRPARDWPAVNGNHVAERFDMNNLQIVLPNAWIWPGHYGQGHAYGLQRSCCTDPSTCPPSTTCDVARLFGLNWVPGTFRNGHRDDDPNYYGHWHYDQVAHPLTPLPAQDPNFFQIIDYAMNQAIGVNNPNHVRNTFQVGAALIDEYDNDDVWDGPDPNAGTGNTITIIDYDGNPLNYAYGIEALSFENPNDNPNRPPFAPYPPPVPANYVLLNRRFENVGEFGYAYNPASTTPSRTLDFASATSNDRGLLDFFTYNSASSRAGIVNLNTRNAPVLASIIRGAWLHDLSYEVLPPDPTYLVSQSDALAAGLAIVGETTSNPVLTRADVARLAEVAGGALPGVPGASADEKKQTIARALAETGQARTWNLMIDVIAQTGKYAPGTADLSDPTKFIVEGEKRYWLHIALDRDDGTVLGTQLEEVIE
jgi:hypothetical protein